MPREIEFEGAVHEFPDDATDDEIRRALGGKTIYGPKQQPAPTAGDRAMEFLTSAWEKIDPIAQVKGISQAVQHPLGAAQGMLQAQGDLAVKAKQEFEAGNYAAGLRHSLNYLIPLLGPELDAAGEKFAQGEYAKGAGETVGIGLNLAAPSLAGKIKGLRVSPRFVNPNAAEAAAVTYLADQGVPVSAAARTSSPFVGGVQNLVGATPGGSFIAQRAKKATTRGLERLSGELAEKTHPTAMTREGAGLSLQAELAGKARQLGQTADVAYTDFRALEAATPMPVDVTGIKAQLLPIYDHMNQWMQPAKRQASQGYQAIESILKGPDTIPASVAEDGLSGVKALAREGSGRNAGLAKFVLPKLQQEIDNAVGSANPAALRALQEGRSTVAQQATTKGVLKKLRTEPVAAFEQMTYAKDAGIDMLRKVAAEAPGEMPKIGRAYLESVFEKVPSEGFKGAAEMQRRWSSLGPETKKLLYRDPRLIKNLDDFFLGAKKIAENPNPSGSAIVGWTGAGALALLDPVTAVKSTLGTAALAKLLYSPRGAKLLNEGLRIPLGRPAQASAIVGQILSLSGKERERRPELTPAHAY